MIRITISLPDDLARAARLEARRRREPLSAFVRDALSDKLGSPEGMRRRIPFAALGAGDGGDAARRVDEILAREWTLERLRDGKP